MNDSIRKNEKTEKILNFLAKTRGLTDPSVLQNLYIFIVLQYQTAILQGTPKKCHRIGNFITLYTKYNYSSLWTRKIVHFKQNAG